MKKGDIISFRTYDGSIHHAKLVKIHENGSLEIDNGTIMHMGADDENLNKELENDTVHN